MSYKCIVSTYIPGHSYVMNKCKHRPKEALANRGGNNPAEINIALEDKENKRVRTYEIAGVARRVAYEHGFKLSKGIAENIAESLKGRKMDVSPNGEIENLHAEIDDIVRGFKRRYSIICLKIHSVYSALC